MNQIMKFVCIAGFSLYPLVCMTAPPAELVGKYIGTGDEKSLNHDTGKLSSVIKYPVEITIDSSGGFVIDYTDMGNAVPYTKPIYGTKIITFRRQHSNGVVSMGKFKITGKGNKLKGVLSFSGEDFWTESSLSLTKVNEAL